VVEEAPDAVEKTDSTGSALFAGRIYVEISDNRFGFAGGRDGSSRGSGDGGGSEQGTANATGQFGRTGAGHALRTALDTLDADAYAGVFTADAELDVAGNVKKGRQQIREIVTGLQRSRDENKAKGTPSPALYHVISNTTIEILKNEDARHRSFESDGGDQFFCGGEKSGKVRTVRRPRRGSPGASGSKARSDSPGN
jgi:hypothetical protein